MRQIRKVAMLGVLGLTLSACVDDLVAPPPPPTDVEVIHYWHFNDLPSGTLTSAVADVSALGGAEITYPGTGDGYMDRVDPGSDLNAREGALAGFGLRPRNPANTRELIITTPSTGYKDIVVTFAVQRSSSGAQQEEFYYSANGGATWTLLGAAYDINEDFEVKTMDLSEISAVENDANLRFRILFIGEAATGSSGNNRFDNVAVEGIPLQ